MVKLVLLRHGQSDWNLKDLFTGWTDVDITEQGAAEARKAGQQIKAAGLTFDLCFTSVLKRAINTQHLALAELDQLWLPDIKSWRLNERHYGALQGLNKHQTAEKHGADQVFIWRRSWDVPPPKLEPDDERSPMRDPRYRIVPKEELPLTESLKDTVARVLPFWHASIAPALGKGVRVLITAHGNSLRGLVKYLSAVPDADIPKFELPTGVPLVYDLDADLKPVERYFLK